VKHSYTRSLSLLILIALRSPAAELPFVRGQIRSSTPRAFQGLMVGMEDVISHVQIHRVDVRFDGGFEFRGVPAGDYTLVVSDLHGSIVTQEIVNIHEHMDEIAIRLPDSGRRPWLPGKVSVTQLMHPPEKKAVQAFHSALRFSESGKYDQAITALEKAVSLSPDFGEAHTNLAVQYIRRNRFEQAAAESRRAMEIGGPDPINLCNLGFVQFQLGQYADAEASARAALNLDAGYLQAHLVLGSVLARNRATWPEAIAHLEKAATKFASAQQTLDALRKGR
jgi:hypothetical protein